MSEVGASHVDEKLGLHIVPKTKVCYKLDSLAFIIINCVMVYLSVINNDTDYCSYFSRNSL